MTYNFRSKMRRRMMMKNAPRKIKPVIKMLVGSIFAVNPTRKIPFKTIFDDAVVSARANSVCDALLTISEDRFWTLID